MTLDNLVTPEIKLNLFGEEWKIEFKLRNFAALKQICNINENQLLQGLINGDISKIPFAIWTATLVFAPFDVADPLKIEKQMNLEDLFNLSLAELKEANDQLIKAIEAYLPKQPEGTKKKTVKKVTNKPTK